VTPWFDWLFLSPCELNDVLRGTGWHVAKLVQNETRRYVAVLEKD